MPWAITDIIMEKRLKWLGHVGRMDEGRFPKQLMFGELHGEDYINPWHKEKMEIYLSVKI
jgi:hypothetical protein